MDNQHYNYYNYDDFPVYILHCELILVNHVKNQLEQCYQKRVIDS